MKIFVVAFACFSVAAALSISKYEQILTSKSINPRIIGGVPARAGQFPFSAAIYIDTAGGRFFCGGTLISDSYVLSAATCLDGATLLTIHLGSNSLTGNDPYRQTLATDEYIIHSDYDSSTLVNNIGLIKFRIPVLFNDYVKPIEYLPITDLTGASPGTTLGWGQTSDSTEGPINLLQFVRVTTITNPECSLTFGNAITDGMVCIDGNYNQGTCIGDLGAPFIQQLALNQFVIVAVSSFISGNGCESTDPSGFTRVFPYKDWILENSNMYP